MSILAFLQAAQNVPGVEMMEVTVGVVGGQAVWKMVIEKLLDKLSNGEKHTFTDIVNEIKGLRSDIMNLHNISDIKRENDTDRIISTVKQHARA